MIEKGCTELPVAVVQPFYICKFAYKLIHTRLEVSELHIGNMINSIGVMLVAYIVCYFCKSVKKILILRNAS